MYSVGADAGLVSVHAADECDVDRSHTSAAVDLCPLGERDALTPRSAVVGPTPRPVR